MSLMAHLRSNYKASVSETKLALFCTIEGLSIVIVPKRPDNRNSTSKAQEKLLKEVEDAGGLSFIAWDTEVIDENLESIGLQAIEPPY